MLGLSAFCFFILIRQQNTTALPRQKLRQHSATNLPSYHLLPSQSTQSLVSGLKLACHPHDLSLTITLVPIHTHTHSARLHAYLVSFSSSGLNPYSQTHRSHNNICKYKYLYLVIILANCTGKDSPAATSVIISPSEMQICAHASSSTRSKHAQQ
jgi:hypothetical protein